MVDYRKYIMDILADKYVFNNSEIADYALIPFNFWHMKKYLPFVSLYTMPFIHVRKSILLIPGTYLSTGPVQCRPLWILQTKSHL